MGEAATNSDGTMEFDAQETGERSRMKIEAVGGGSGAAEAAASVVSWERFLPKMVIRVLLVEADDSTRQIIAALLRKCSYRVAAVPDGLKAWELLKGRPRNIDLILTEVELPSISGYALLTLIMEHEVCKNIPVIMMSSHDSVSTVYKCMLRGAADFLVKPVRKNELRNLWQHVWRKQASNTGTGLGPPFESVAQEKDEATAENNETSNNSSGCKSSIQRNRECIEKGSDAQSSCTKPEFGTEKEDTDPIQHFSLPKSVKCLADEVKYPAQEECRCGSRKRQERDQEDGEVQPVQKMFASHTATRRVENAQERVNMVTNSTHILENSSRVVINLIGGFDNHLRGTLESPYSNISTNKFDVLPLLDLSLRRSHPGGSVKQQNDEMHKLNHSDASPFSRYINKSLLLHSSTLPGTFNQQKDHVTNDSDTAKIASIQEGKQENAFSYSQTGEISHPIPVKGVRLENLLNSYCAKGPSSLPSPGTAQHSESSPRVNALYLSESQPSTSHQCRTLVDNQSINNSNEQTDSKLGKKMENLEDTEHVSPANDQSTKSSFCNGQISNIPSAGCGSNGNINSVPIAKAPVECGNEESFHAQEGSSHRSIQREAALTKFRLKRKDRCFEKKVRYESRKKLAEQRPRVKGQFVRQAPNDSQPRNSSAG